MKIKIFALLVPAMCLFVAEAIAQSVPAKFGKVDEAELNMKTYDKDTSAAAIVLSDVGFSYFSYNTGFKVIYERHTRVKVLKKSGYDVANIVIPYIQQPGGKEYISNIKGYTYNVEGGKTIKHKLDASSMYDEKLNDIWYSKTMTMPNVKEGSVIEYSYSISSDFLFNLRSWEFQTTVPVVYSAYSVRIPEYFNFKQENQGYLPFDVSKAEGGFDNFIMPNADRVLLMDEASKGVKISNTTFKWVIKDAPALRQEDHITTLRDYQSRIDFELQTINYPGRLPQVVIGNWDKVTHDLMNAERFGAQLNRKGFFKHEVAAIVTKHREPEQQMAAIYDLVKNTVKWNGVYGYGTSGPIRKAFENRAGNIADINLMLVAMLQDAGLDAAPVLLSTRENGRAPMGAPMLHKFNYVIAHVIINGKEHLLDATDPLVPAGMLPVHCLNGQGRLIKREDQRWVDLVPAGMYSSFFSGDLAISPTGSMNGKITESSSGYQALRLRKKIKDDGEEKYAEESVKELGNYKIEKPAFANLHSLGESLNISYNLTANGNDRAVDVIYLNPMLGQGEKESPFKPESRVYPVDLAVPIDKTYICRFTLPKGYELEESPKNTIVTLPDNGGQFMYMVQREGGVVQIMSKVSVLKPIYYAPDYPYLKEFYNQIVAKHAEQIVLKKVSQ